jgi:hypothetical protein
MSEKLRKSLPDVPKVPFVFPKLQQQPKPFSSLSIPTSSKPLLSSLQPLSPHNPLSDPDAPTHCQISPPLPQVPKGEVSAALTKCFTLYERHIYDSIERSSCGYQIQSSSLHPQSLSSHQSSKLLHPSSLPAHSKLSFIEMINSIIEGSSQLGGKQDTSQTEIASLLMKEYGLAPANAAVACNVIELLRENDEYVPFCNFIETYAKEHQDSR